MELDSPGNTGEKSRFRFVFVKFSSGPALRVIV